MKYETRATRDAFGEVLIELGNKFPNLIIVDADNSKATRTSEFALNFPDRFINVGVAEQNMVGVAAGLALGGKIPIISTHAIFLCGRAYEQIRNSVAYSNLNVKCVGTHGGISVGHDGPTHFSIEDIALMRAMPNMTVVVPADASETTKAMRAIINHVGPSYIRLGRAPIPIVMSDFDFQLGRGIVVKDGHDVAIFACGLMLAKALEASRTLRQQGIQAAVVNIHTVKPLDVDLVIRMAKQCQAIVVAEEHNVFGGLGGAIAEAVCMHNPVPMEFVGIPDVFARSGSMDDLLDEFGLATANIVQSVQLVLKRRANISV